MNDLKNYIGVSLSASNIGQNIRRLRNLHDTKQEELAKKLGISRQTLHHYENNKYRMPDGLITAVSDFFGIEHSILYLPSIVTLLDKGR